MRILTTKQVQELTGFSEYKVLALIRTKKLPAVNTSAGSKKPRWAVRPEDLEAFLTPPQPEVRVAKPARNRKVRRIDEGIPNYLGL